MNDEMQSAYTRDLRRATNIYHNILINNHILKPPPSRTKIYCRQYALRPGRRTNTRRRKMKLGLECAHSNHPSAFMGLKPVSLAKTTRPSFSGVLPRKRLFGLLDEARRGPAIRITGPRGMFARCEYQMSPPHMGAGTCTFYQRRTIPGAHRQLSAERASTRLRRSANCRECVAPGSRMPVLTSFHFSWHEIHKWKLPSQGQKGEPATPRSAPMR